MKLRYVVSVASVLGAILSFHLQQEAKANVADDLNTNYNKVIDNCGSENSPGYLCSGNIVRYANATTNYHAWDPSPKSIERGGVSFIYLRKDVNYSKQVNTTGGQTTGMIFYPPEQKPQTKSNVETSCIFPIDGWSDTRPDGGCGVSTAYPKTSQRCQEQNIYTAEEWHQHFANPEIQYAGVFQNQCAFDMTKKMTNIAAAFNEAIKAHNEVADTQSGYTEYGYPELQLKAWPTYMYYYTEDNVQKEKQLSTNPDQLPIQAFFYSKNEDLLRAQFIQKDYYRVTGLFVPIVRLAVKSAFDVSYSYNDKDQFIYNDTDQFIADNLNTNYNNIVEDCGSKNNPAYQCSGILLRQTSYSSGVHNWDPNAKSIQYDGMSFAYFRKDIKIKNFMQPNRHSGFIYYPSQLVPTSKKSAKVSCVFPAVGQSDNRSYGRCGSTTVYPTTSVECQQQGINDADSWYKHFTNNDVSGYGIFEHQCAFDVSNCGHNTADAFIQSIKAHNMVYDTSSAYPQYGSNEVVVKTPATSANGQTTNPEVLPLQAFFYIDTTGLTEAKKYQQDYYNITGQFVPVVYMNTTNFDNISFKYQAADQVVLKSAN